MTEPVYQPRYQQHEILVLEKRAAEIAAKLREFGPYQKPTFENLRLKEKSTKSRIVRFLPVEDNQYVPSKLSYDRKDMEAMWWSRSDMQAIRKSAIYVAKSQIKRHWRDINRIYSSSMHYNTRDCTTESVRLSLSELRGLEGMSYPDLKRRRREKLRTFIEADSNLPSSMKSDARESYLSTVSRRLSRHSSRMALVQASGDALVAQSILEEGENAPVRFRNSDF